MDVARTAPFHDGSVGLLPGVRDLGRRIVCGPVLRATVLQGRRQERQNTVARNGLTRNRWSGNLVDAFHRDDGIRGTGLHDSVRPRADAVLRRARGGRHAVRALDRGFTCRMEDAGASRCPARRRWTGDGPGRQFHALQRYGGDPDQRHDRARSGFRGGLRRHRHRRVHSRTVLAGVAERLAARAAAA